MRAPIPPVQPPPRPGRWRAIALLFIGIVYLVSLAVGTGICLALSWKAGLP